MRRSSTSDSTSSVPRSTWSARSSLEAAWRAVGHLRNGRLGVGATLVGPLGEFAVVEAGRVLGAGPWRETPTPRTRSCPLRTGRPATGPPSAIVCGPVSRRRRRSPRPLPAYPGSEAVIVRCSPRSRRSCPSRRWCRRPATAATRRRDRRRTVPAPRRRTARRTPPRPTRLRPGTPRASALAQAHHAGHLDERRQIGSHRHLHRHGDPAPLQGPRGGGLPDDGSLLVLIGLDIDRGHPQGQLPQLSRHQGRVPGPAHPGRGSRPSRAAAARWRARARSPAERAG